jgi:hypothetical protein
LLCAVLGVLLSVSQASTTVASIHQSERGEVQLSDGGWTSQCAVQVACRDVTDQAFGLSHDELPVPHHHHHADTHWGVEADEAAMPQPATLAVAAPLAMSQSGLKQTAPSDIEQPPRG